MLWECFVTSKQKEEKSMIFNVAGLSQHIQEPSMARALPVTQLLFGCKQLLV
jgi:hypothetical protein